MKKKIRKKDISLIIGIIIIGFFLLVCIAPKLFTGLDPAAQNVDCLLEAPSRAHWFGTDNFGRDVFARVIYGTRVDLSIGIFAMLIPLVIGTFIGVIVGYYGGKVDMVVMRIVDAFTIFPFMIFVIMIVAIAGTGIRNVFLAIWLVGWKEYTRIIRSEVIVEKNKEYVQAAKTLGYSDFRIIFGHILPNVINSAIIYGSSDIIICIMAGASLSFLGLGVQAPTSEWGMMISEGKTYMTQAPWLCLCPGFALVIASVGFSLLGDGITDRLRKQER